MQKAERSFMEGKETGQKCWLRVSFDFPYLLSYSFIYLTVLVLGVAHGTFDLHCGMQDH